MSQFLTWFTVCDYNTLEYFGAPSVCFHCSICLAGFPDKRLFFDADNNIAMLLSKNTNTNHHFEIDITLGMFSNVNKSWLSSSQGDLLLQEQNVAVNCENHCTMLKMIQWYDMILSNKPGSLFLFSKILAPPHAHFAPDRLLICQM